MLHTVRVRDAHLVSHDVEIRGCATAEEAAAHILKTTFPGGEVLDVLPKDEPKPEDPKEPLAPPVEQTPAETH